MSREGYIASKATRIAEIQARAAQARAAAGIVGRLIDTYGYFDGQDDGKPLKTPEAAWNKDSPGEIVWMEFYDTQGRTIEGPAALQPVTRQDRLRVDRADFIFGPDETIFGRVFSITLNPPIVLGLEGEKLEAPEIEGVITDLTAYENALNTQSEA